MAEIFRYAAFISYSSKDAAFASRLHRALENYTIPKTLGAFDLIGGGKKNRIYPVFRDREELAARGLGEQIDAALTASAALIVVCSPNSVASPWVQHEIDFFVKAGRRDRIFAIIPDTAPLVDESGADVTAQCLPPLIRGDGEGLAQLAADARKGRDAFRNAWLKVAAGMVSKSPGELIDRDVVRRRQQRNSLVIGAIGLGVLLACGGAWLDARSWRSDMTAYAQAMTSSGQPLDGMPFAVAGLPTIGDVIGVSHANAVDVLVQTGAQVPHLDLGRLLDLIIAFGFSPDSNFLLTIDDAQNGALYDLEQRPIATSALGTTVNFGFSPDGKFLITQGLDDNGILRDLRARGRPPLSLGRIAPDFGFSGNGAYFLTMDSSREGTLRSSIELELPPQSVGAVWGYRFSDNGRFLLVLDRQFHGTLYELRARGLTAHAVGRLRDFAFSPSGDLLAVVDRDRNALLLNLDDLRQAPRGFGQTDGFIQFSRDDRHMLIRDEEGQMHVHSLGAPNATARRLGALGVAGFSSNGRNIFAVARDGQGVLFDFQDETPRLLGPTGAGLFSPRGRYLLVSDRVGWGQLYDLNSSAETPTQLGALANGGFAFSSDDEFLLTRNQEGIGALRTLASLHLHPHSLGPVERFGFSADSRFMLTQAPDGSAALRDIEATPLTPPLRTAVCERTHELRPFPHSLRQGEIESVSASHHLIGRPWNPCDWRGLLAIVRNDDRGDDWFEGLRQWLRLMHVRYFNGNDYACEDVTSRASAETRRRRADMCARFANREASQAPN